MKGSTKNDVAVLRLSQKIAVLLVVALFLHSCATLDPNYEEPTVILSSFRAVPSDGIVPSFEVGLRIINPNATPLDLEGVVYSISLQGQELVKGVGKGFPQIEGYSEGNIKLSASANLLSGVRLITGMMKQKNESLEYEFEAKLDLAGFYPSLKISETGILNFNDLGKVENNQ
jgi:LEA14-like dessication related protein